MISRKTKAFLHLFASLPLLIPPAMAEPNAGWNRFRGPQGSGVAAGREFKEIHSHDLGEEAETTPAIDQNSFYIRTEKHLIAFRKSE